MNALGSEKSLLKAIEVCAKMSCCKVLHGIQSGNDGDLDTANYLYMKILCVRARPLTFFVRQGKTPHFLCASGQGSLRDLRESGWDIGSRDCFTGDTV